MYIGMFGINITFGGMIAFICVSIWLAIYFVHFVAIVYGKYYLYSWRWKERKETSVNSPGVSIIKTIAGASDNTLTNLETIFQLEYPKFEVLICMQEVNTQLAMYIEEMMARYPSVDATLFQGAKSVGVNPKINNILQCYDLIKYEYLWICDNSIIVHRHTLLEISHHLTAEVGMVHQIPFFSGDIEGFGSCLERVYFGTQHARWYLFFYAAGIACTNGMSSVIRKKVLDDVGGISAFSMYIAEDFFIGQSLVNRGIKITLSTEPAIQSPTDVSVKRFLDRMTRWQKLRLTMIPTTVLEPLIECLMIGVLGAFGVSFLFNQSFATVYMLHVLGWFISDQILMCILEKKYANLPPLWQRLPAWILREFSTYLIFMSALWNQSIEWNVGSFTLKYGGQAVSVEKQN